MSWIDPPLDNCKWQSIDGKLLAAYHPNYQQLALYRINEKKFLFSSHFSGYEITNCKFSPCNHFLFIETRRKSIFILDFSTREIIQVLERESYCSLFWIEWLNKNSLLCIINLVKNRIFLYHRSQLVLEISIHGIKDVKSISFDRERIIIDGEREFYLSKVPKIDKVLEKYSIFEMNVKGGNFEKYVEDLSRALSNNDKQRYKILMDDFLSLLTPLFIFEELNKPVKQVIDQLYEIYDQLENNNFQSTFNPIYLLHAVSFLKSNQNFSIFLTATAKL